MRKRAGKIRKQITDRLDLLDRDKDHLMSMVAAFSSEVLNTAPIDGGWSPLQVVEHLMISEDFSIGYLKKKLSSEPDIPSAGLRASLRSISLLLALRSPLKFRAPSRVAVVEMSHDLAQLEGQWHRSRGDMRTYLSTLDEGWLYKAVYRHPRVGRLTVIQMLDFFKAHFERHQRQILRRLPMER